MLLQSLLLRVILHTVLGLAEKGLLGMEVMKNWYTKQHWRCSFHSIDISVFQLLEQFIELEMSLFCSILNLLVMITLCSVSLANVVSPFSFIFLEL